MRGGDEPLRELLPVVLRSPRSCAAGMSEGERISASAHLAQAQQTAEPLFRKKTQTREEGQTGVDSAAHPPSSGCGWMMTAARPCRAAASAGPLPPHAATQLMAVPSVADTERGASDTFCCDD